MFKISIIINQLSDVNINGVKSQVSQIQMPIHLPFIFMLVLAYKQMYNNEVFTMSDFFQLLEGKPTTGISAEVENDWLAS